MEQVAEIELDEHQEAVARYYRECWLDYKFFWINRRNLGMHFGYWDETTRTHAQSLERTNEVMADAVGIGPADRVLDAGCGVGGSSIWLATHRGSQVVGVNVSPEQVAHARRFVRDRGVADRVTILQRDYKNTGMPAESFDVVWMCESIAHSPDQRDTLAEAFRLLRPGGRLIVRDVYLARPPVDDLDHQLVTVWEDAWVMPPLPTQEQFLSWVSGAGFAQVHMEDVTHTGVRSGRHLYRMSLAALPFAVAMRKLGLRSDVQHTNVTGSIAAWKGYQRGLWAAGHTSAVKPPSS